VCKTSGNSFTELRVTRAYIRLFFLPEDKNGARTASLARTGNYEVRLVELSQTGSAEEPPLWMELYARDIQSTIDSCSCADLEEAVAAADQLIDRAMNERPPRQESKVPCL